MLLRNRARRREQAECAFRFILRWSKLLELISVHIARSTGTCNLLFLGMSPSPLASWLRFPLLEFYIRYVARGNTSLILAAIKQSYQWAVNFNYCSIDQTSRLHRNYEYSLRNNTLKLKLLATIKSYRITLSTSITISSIYLHAL